MSGELERLLVKIEADTSLLRRELAAADKGVTGFSNNTDRNLKRSKNNFSGFETAVSGGLKKMAAGFALLGGASKALDSIAAAGNINDLSRNAALSTDTFQAYAFAAEKAGMATDAFSKASQKFAVNVAQARAETGGFNTFLDAQLPKLGAQIRASKDQEAAFRLVANAIQNLKSEEDKTTLAMEAFGKQGADLVEVLAQGAEGLDAATVKARELGVIQSGELLTSAEKLGDQYRELGKTIEGTWQRAAVGAAGYFDDLKNSWVGFAAWMAGDNPTQAAQKTAASSGTQNPTRTMFPLLPSGLNGSKETQLQPSAAKSGEWVTEINTRGADALRSLNAQLAASTSDAFDDIKQSYDSDLTEFERLLAAKEIDEAEFYEAKSKLQQISAEKTSAVLAQEREDARGHFAEIEGLIDNTFMGAFSEALETGKFKADEFFKKLLNGFAEMTMQALVLKPILDSLFQSGGAGASLFSSLGFGGARAAGGPVLGGKAHLVGERGPELFIPNSSGRIMSNGATSRMGGGSTTYNIDARGADISVAERIERALAMSNRSQKDPVSTVAKQQRRFPTRGY